MLSVEEKATRRAAGKIYGFTDAYYDRLEQPPKRRGLSNLGCTRLFLLIALALAFTAEFLQFETSIFLLVVIFIAAAVLALVLSLD
jgi:hypothetical protein